MAADDLMHDNLPAQDLHLRGILGAVAAVLVILALAFGVLLWFYRANTPQNRYLVPSLFPQPRVLQDGSDELQALQRRQHQTLRSYAWVDRGQGVISVPISVAMRAIAAKGAGGYAPLIEKKTAPSDSSGQPPPPVQPQQQPPSKSQPSSQSQSQPTPNGGAQ